MTDTSLTRFTGRDLFFGNGIDPGTPTDGYLRFWLPILGPSAVFAFHFLNEATGRGAHHAAVDLADLSHDIGLGRGTAKNSKIRQTLNRLRQFRLLSPEIADQPNLIISTTVPTLHNGHLNRIRPGLARLERQWREAHANVTRLPADP